MKQALGPYCIGGAFGNLLDAEAEQLGCAAFQTFETEGLSGSAAAPAVLFYLFHTIERRLDGSGSAAVGEAAFGAATSPLRKTAASIKQSFRDGGRAAIANTGGKVISAPGSPPAPAEEQSGPPAWAKAFRDRQAVAHGATLAAHTLRSGDSSGMGASIDISQKD